MSNRLLAPLGFTKPEIPALVPEPPSGDGWIHEIKHDGYRTLIVIEGGKVRLDGALSKGGRSHSRASMPGSHHRRRDHRPGRERHFRLRRIALGHPQSAAS